jgi:protein-S-isoprenylcysteine O-methyltransferase Ste14
MNSVRYFIALVTLISLPPAILLWFAIHPFARFWRKLGPVWTYALLGVPMGLLMVAVFLARRRLLAIDFGTSPALITLSVLTIAVGSWMAVRRRKLLTHGILVGLPELSQRRYPGKLLTEGVYAKIRHPRYIEALLWTLGYALFANYLAVYIAFLLAIPGLYLVVLLEERELRERFGAEYDEYCRRVPRFVPRAVSRS